MSRGTSFLDSSLKIDGILDILKILSVKPYYFHDLCKTSKIQFKKSFLKYLNFCYEKNLVKKTNRDSFMETTSYGTTYNKRYATVFYSITTNGKKFMELVK